MPIWLPHEPASMADDKLTCWRAFEALAPGLDGPTIHLVGYVEREGAGRVTSPLMGMDRITRTCTTRSCSSYRLVGAPGLNGDAEYVWRRWLRLWSAEVVRGATEDVLRELESGVQAMPITKGKPK